MAQAAIEDAKALLHGKAGLGPRYKLHAGAREDTICSIHPGHHTASARFQAGTAASTSARIATLSTLSGKTFIFPVSNAGSQKVIRAVATQLLAVTGLLVTEN